MAEFVLYSYFRSSASFRVRIAMNLKGIAFEYRAVHLLNEGGEQFRDDYRRLNPSREVPTLVHQGKSLSQSVAILDYLDAVRPEPRLFPKDPFGRAVVLQACEIVNSGTQPLMNLRVLNELGTRFGADQAGKDEWVRHWVRYGLESLEGFLKPRSGKFSFGDELTAADCFVIPQLFGADRFQVDLSPYPTLRRIRENCEALDAFKKAAPAVQPDTPPAN